jgi:hypothetical protein
MTNRDWWDRAKQPPTIGASYNAADYVALQPGSTLGPYEVLALIGAGGMGASIARRSRGAALRERGILGVVQLCHSHDRPAIARMKVIRSFSGT